jgi:hypothetical protein
MRRVRAAALYVLACTGGFATACEPGLAGATQRAEGARHVIAWRSAPAAPRVSEFFALEVAVCTRGGGAPPQALRVDAWMPAHRHGMNYRPTVQRRSDGRFDVSGLLFHMPGRWEFVFDVRAAEAGETVRATVDLR